MGIDPFRKQGEGQDVVLEIGLKKKQKTRK